MQFIKRKRVYVPLLITLILAITCIRPLADLLADNASERFDYKEIILQNQEHAMSSGYAYNSDTSTLIVTNQDPWIMVQSKKASNIIEVSFQDALPDTLTVQIFYSDTTAFQEANSVIRTIKTGEKKLSVPFGNDYYNNFRIDIGSAIDEQINVDSIQTIQSPDQSMAAGYVIGLSLLVFVVLYAISHCTYVTETCRAFIDSSWMKRNRNILIALGIGTGCFFILYYKYIYLGEAYIFSRDLCADTLDLIYPSYHLLSESIHAGNLSAYSLQAGFGMNMIGSLSTLLNPLNILIWAFPPDRLEIAIIISVYLKMMLVILFAVKYFQLILNHKKAIILTSLLWGANCYFIIWGQQYGFANNIVYFTIFVYYLHLLCTSQKCMWRCIAILTLLGINGYYFFYSIGVFAIIYVVLYHAFNRNDWRVCVRCIMKLAGYTFIAIGLSAFVLLPNICLFLNSARTGDIAQKSMSMFQFVDLKTVLSMLGRFMSPNLLGTALEGTLYSNSNELLNYYEMAFLNTGIISIYGIVHHVMLTYRHRKLNLLVIGVIGISLCTYMVSFLIVFGYNFRWTYMLVFLQIVLIGRYLQFLFEPHADSIRNRITYRSSILVIILNILLLMGDILGLISVDKTILMFIDVIMILYFLCTRFWKRAYLPILFSIVLIAELIFHNYAAINHRGTESIERLADSYYFDGTIQSIDALKKYDQGLYRVNKDYYSRFYNDAYVQGYYGVSVYNSLNSAQLQRVLTTYGVESAYDHPNYYSLESDNLLLNGLFGVAYIVKDNQTFDTNLVVDREYPVYKNPYTYPFGFLYDRSVNVQNADQEELLLSTLYGYFSDYTTGENMDVSSLYTVENKSFTVVNDTIVIDESVTMKNSMDELCVTYNAGEEGSATLYYSQNQDFTDAQEITFDVEKGTNEQSFYIPDLYLEKNLFMRMEISQGRFELVSFVVKHIDDEQVMAQLTKFRNQSLYNVIDNGDHIQATIDNHGDINKMLFIPIIYSDEWHISVDGEIQEIQNINGGFIGTEIAPGTHEIELIFVPQGWNVGLRVSILTLIAMFMFYLYQKRKTHVQFIAEGVKLGNQKHEDR